MKFNLESKLSKGLLDFRFRGTRLDPQSLIRIHHSRRRSIRSRAKVHPFWHLLLPKLRELNPGRPISTNYPSSSSSSHFCLQNSEISISNHKLKNTHHQPWLFKQTVPCCRFDCWERPSLLMNQWARQNDLDGKIR